VLLDEAGDRFQYRIGTRHRTRSISVDERDMVAGSLGEMVR
jgi:hypothetical protein